MDAKDATSRGTAYLRISNTNDEVIEKYDEEGEMTNDMK